MSRIQLFFEGTWNVSGTNVNGCVDNVSFKCDYCGRINDISSLQ